MTGKREGRPPRMVAGFERNAEQAASLKEERVIGRLTIIERNLAHISASNLGRSAVGTRFFSMAPRLERVWHYIILKCTGIADPQNVCFFVPLRTEQEEIGCHQHRTPDARGRDLIEAGDVSIKLIEPYLLEWS